MQGKAAARWLSGGRALSAEKTVSTKALKGMQATGPFLPPGSFLRTQRGQHGNGVSKGSLVKEKVREVTERRIW